MRSRPWIRDDLAKRRGSSAAVRIDQAMLSPEVEC